MLAVIRVRGSIRTKIEINDTMKMLRLFRVNHLVLISEKKQMKKMVEKVKDYVTYGEIEAETLEKVLSKRAFLKGNKKVLIEYLKEKKINSFKELAEKIIKEEIQLKDLEIKPVFRLKPPKKGYERAGIKKAYSIGGALGYRATEINKLINKMV
ncbi:MAG: 50S ribosomal protein L30 [Candidatus Diapherotrites archaeon CG10_big_fil_rev_8_21_14_0_10_31_34]|nr:MAG: 50S ribosomal protein L30 [Candidatus Diapherotrites archaeon CG10_big_fil_rev_8_21_14_0_10_31_34]